MTQRAEWKKRAYGLAARLVNLIVVGLFLTTPPSWAQEAPAKRPLSHSDYDSWRSIASPSLSPDGRWLCYIETPQDSDAELVVIHLHGPETYRQLVGYSGEGTEAHKTASATFSRDARHVAFLISPDKEKAKAAKKASNKDKPKKKLGILNLSDGTLQTVDQVKSFAMPKEAAGWIAYLHEKKEAEEKKGEGKEEKEQKKREKKRTYGTPLVVQAVADTARKTVLEDVVDYRFTKDGRYLFYVVSSKEHPERDGAYFLHPGDTTGVPLMNGKGEYKHLTLNKDETQLAFLTDKFDQEAQEPTFVLSGCAVGAPKATVWVSHTTTPGFPKGMAVSDKSPLTFSDDGKVVMFGIKEIAKPAAKDDSLREEAKFDLWHWQDPYPQPEQKKMAKEVRDNTWECVYHLERKRFVQLADKDLPDVELGRTGKVAFAQNPWPYAPRASYDAAYHDIYVVNTATGKRTLVRKELRGRAQLSPEGRYVTWFDDGHWHCYEVARGVSRNLTATLGVSFAREEHDTPEPAPPYGSVGWTKGDRSFLVYDRYDLWELFPDGRPARMVTEGQGRTHKVSFRYVKLDPDEVAIDPAQPLILKATSEETMAEGFYHDSLSGEQPPVKLVTADRSFGTPSKALSADVLLLTRSAFDEYPDLWVSDRSFQQLCKVTDLGRQMVPFLWGKARLRTFRNADGVELKGVLITPADFDPSHRYPLIVYIYERMHQTLHQFRHPGPGTSINPSYYASNGYLIWMPDIVYSTGFPGRDALKCVLPGIQMLVAEGYVDPEAIGIQGHSWGGYQVAYMITQTDIFAAAEAGAPVCNMVSAYGGIRWESGKVRQFQYERTQSRIGATLWEAPLRFIENSPIFWADKVRTPLLILHNDNDGAVPWYQGIEYMMALRRLGKTAFMFNYIGEEHGLRKRVNQKDWTVRLAEFFDHYLKKSPAPAWLTDGIKAWEKEEEEKEGEGK